MKDTLSLKEKIVQAQFELLKEHLGETVEVVHYENGKLFTERLIMLEVRDYTGIRFNHIYMPFIGYNCAIKSINTLDGRNLYEARGLYEPYQYYDGYQLIEIARRVFGPTEAMRREQELVAFKKQEDEEERKEQEDVKRYQKEELPKLLIESKSFILEDKYEEWKKLCIVNSKSYYSITIIKTIIEVLRLIAEGKSFDEAMTIVGKEYGTTGYSDGLIAGTVSKFAKIGKEFKKYWNGQYTDEEMEGAINPAVIHTK